MRYSSILFKLIIFCTILMCTLCACQGANDKGGTAPASTDSPHLGSATDAVIPSTQTNTITDTPAIPAGMESSLPSSSSTVSQDDAAQKPNADMQTANSLIGQEISALYDAIGEPADSSYVQSCLGAGEDGELYYDGFTVVTYREGDSEVIRGVY